MTAALLAERHYRSPNAIDRVAVLHGTGVSVDEGDGADAREPR